MARHGSNRFNISAEVSSVLPQHISNESPDLEVFLQKYLEFIETDNKALYYLNTISSSRDIDDADETFLPRLQNEIGQAIPRKFSAEPRLLYKHLTELYKSRGTIESIKAFFRFFYDDEVEIYYPKDDMFTPSDGKWFSQFDLILDNPSNFTPSYTYTLTSNTTVITGGDDNSDILTYDGLLVYVDDVRNNDFVTSVKPSPTTGPELINNGTFNSNVSGWGNGYNSVVTHDMDNNGYRAKVVWGVGESYASITQTISGLTIGSQYTFKATVDALISGSIRAQISGIGLINPSGNFTSFGMGTIVDSFTATSTSHTLQIMDYGSNSANIYYVDNVSFKEDIPDRNELDYFITFPTAIASGKVIKIYNTGAFTTHDGFLSSYKKLQDSYYYQKFSYVLRTGSNAELWKNSFNRLIHPAGFIFFGEILLTIYLNSILSLNQPGSQFNGLPFPIVIPVTQAKAQFVKYRGSILASYILKELTGRDIVVKNGIAYPEYFKHHVGEFGQREYFDTFKFKLNSPISNWSNTTFIDVTNKTVDGNVETEIHQSLYNTTTTPDTLISTTIV